MTNNEYWEDTSENKPINKKVIVADSAYHSMTITEKKNWLWSYKTQIIAKQQLGLSTEQLFILATLGIKIKVPILHTTLLFIINTELKTTWQITKSKETFV